MATSSVVNNPGIAQTLYSSGAQNAGNVNPAQKPNVLMSQAPTRMMGTTRMSSPDSYASSVNAQSSTPSNKSASASTGRNTLVRNKSSSSSNRKGRGRAGRKKGLEHEEEGMIQLTPTEGASGNKDTEEERPRDTLSRLLEDYDETLSQEEMHKNFKHADAAELQLACIKAINDLEASADKIPDFKVKRKRLQAIMKSVTQQRLRDSLQEVDETQEALEGMMPVDNWVDFRYHLGGGKDGRIEALRAPAVLAKLLKVVSDRSLMDKGMTSIQRRFCDVLSHQKRHGDNQYVVAAKDARVFTEIRSTKKLAEDIRVQMAEKKIPVAVDDWDIVKQLLDCPESGWNKGKARPFMHMIVSDHKLTLKQQVAGWTILRRAVTQLPITMWPYEKLSSRRDLLEEMDRNIMSTYAKMKPKHSFKEARLENRLTNAMSYLKSQLRSAKLIPS